MRKRSRNQVSLGMAGWEPAEINSRRNRNEMQDGLPPVVYAVRVPHGLVKIGYTTDLTTRRRSLRATSDDAMLAFTFGDRSAEKALHERLVDHQHHGEYYFPTPGVLRIVNEMREKVGLPALDTLLDEVPTPT